MIVRTNLQGIGEIQGMVTQCTRRFYADLDEPVSMARDRGCLQVRFTLPWEREAELRQRGLETHLDFADEGRTKLVASYAEVEDRDCEILDASFEELQTFDSKDYRTKNSKDMLIDRRYENISRNLQDIGEELHGKQ